jgi:N-acetylglucosamine malate deacetylase 1
MRDTILIAAPHPDDETLGCGATLLRHIARGDSVHWLIVTDMQVRHGFAAAAVERRTAEIAAVAAAYPFAKVHNLGLAPTRLDVLPQAELVAAVAAVVREVAPSIIYVPFPGDAHSDHAAVFDAVAACTKWFRYHGIRRVLCYETPSETDFGLDPLAGAFKPNCFVDATRCIDRKIEIAQLYAGELGEFPFPRSVQALRALAQVRGAACGAAAAEAFMLLKEIVDD